MRETNDLFSMIGGRLHCLYFIVSETNNVKIVFTHPDPLLAIFSEKTNKSEWGSEKKKYARNLVLFPILMTNEYWFFNLSVHSLYHLLKDL